MESTSTINISNFEIETKNTNKLITVFFYKMEHLFVILFISMKSITCICMLKIIIIIVFIII